MAQRREKSSEPLAATTAVPVPTKRTAPRAARPAVVHDAGLRVKPSRAPANATRTGRALRSREVGTVNVKPGAAALFEVPAEVRRVVSALGSNVVADVLGVSRSQPGRWSSGRERISPINRARLADLDHVLNRLLQVLWPEEAGAWLTAPNPHAGGRPIDVLALRGAGPVIEAIDALAQGAYA